MRTSYKWHFIAIIAVTILASSRHGAQSVGNFGSIQGTVVDPTGAVVPNATVEIHNPVSGFDRTTTNRCQGCISVHQRSLQSLPPDRGGQRIWSLCPGCGAAFVGSGNRADQAQPGNVDDGGHGTSGSRRPDRKRFDLPCRCGSEPLRQGSARKPILVSEFAGYPGDARNRSRFQRPVSWPGRSRGEFVLRRWPADHRPAKQSVLQSNSTSTRFNPWKLSPARRRLSMATRPAS